MTTAAVYLHHGAAHVFDISTLASRRGRGYGSAITHAALDWARARTAPPVARCRPRTTGSGIYRRLGVREVCTFRVYSSKRAVLAGART